MRQFIGGFVLATVLVGGAGAWLVKRVGDIPIRWPSPRFYDQAGAVPEAGYLHVAGTLTGEDMTGGTYLDITCDGDTKVCRNNELSQAGPYRQIFLNTDDYTITTWNADQVVAESFPPLVACNRVRLVIDRTTKVTHYYRIPNAKADKQQCAAIFSRNKVFDWTLGEQPSS